MPGVVVTRCGILVEDLEGCCEATATAASMRKGTNTSDPSCIRHLRPCAWSSSRPADGATLSNSSLAVLQNTVCEGESNPPDSDAALCHHNTDAALCHHNTDPYCTPHSHVRLSTRAGIPCRCGAQIWPSKEGPPDLAYCHSEKAPPAIPHIKGGKRIFLTQRPVLESCGYREGGGRGKRERGCVLNYTRDRIIGGWARRMRREK